MPEFGNSPKSIIKSVEMGWLPSPPHIFSKLLDICHNPDSSVGELVDVIAIDAVLTSKVLRAVNSAVYAINLPNYNLHQAVTFLGHDLVKTMVLTSSMQQLFAGLINSRKKVVCDVWLDSFYCALFSREIAHQLNYEHPQDAYLAGLFHDFGQIIFDAKKHDLFFEILESETEDEIIHKEIEKFGICHSELGACLIEQWSSLSPAIADAVRFHHEDPEQLKGCDTLCQIVAEASGMARHWSRSGIADDKWHSNLIDDEELDKTHFNVQQEMSKIAANLGITISGARSLTQDLLFRDIEKESIRLGRKIRDASLINVMNSNQPQLSTIDSAASLILKIARELQLLFSISDVVLLLPGAVDTEFLILHEVNRNKSVSKFSLDNNYSKIVRSYLEKRNLWIEPETSGGEIMPISDRQIVRRLNHEIAFSIALCSGDQSIGTIVIGCNKVQKSYLASQLNFISGYLKNITSKWLENSRLLKSKTLEDNAKREREKEDIDNLVHEVSNPLSVVGNYIDIIRANPALDNKENKNEIKILKEELERIGNIIINFRDNKNSESLPVLINDELKICIPLYVKSISIDKEVQIKWQLDSTDCEIDITRDALRQVVLNLVKNALEAQKNNAEITVTSHHFVNIDGTIFAQFSISDRGKGIDAITRLRLFSPLSSSKQGANRGLGLSVAAEILASFNGQIKYLENEYGGASFEVLIPSLIKPSQGH